MESLVPEPGPHHWEPGQQVGRYVLLARIAIGGMAEIWLARQMGLKGFEKVVVIKRISDNYCTDPTFVEMFLDEARIAAQLDHPNIVQIHDLGEHEGAYYIAMEYLHGEDLATTVRGGINAGTPLPHSYAAQIIAHAAEGLASAHNKTGLDGKPLGIVHRDVSPQNIFVTYEGVVKMVDFGVAKAANRAQSTSGGQLKGKFSYMSPEQSRGEDIDGRADVWSLGVVLFETVTGTRLFDPKMDTTKLLKEVGSTDPVVLAGVRNPDVPRDLEEIIAQALHRDRKHRFQTALDLRAALEKWLRTVPGAPGTGEVAQYMRRVFGERMGRKAQLIESARAGEIKFFKVPEALKPDSERSMPGDTVLTREKRKRKRRLSALMKAVLAGVTLALVGLGAGVGWRVIRRKPAAVSVVTLPLGARLEIDGVAVGRSPFTASELAAGRHVIVAFDEDGRVQTTTVMLVPGERAEVSLEFPAPPPPPPTPEPLPVAADPPLTKIEMPPTPLDPVRVTQAQPRGKLSIETNPWSRVVWNGKALGETPLIQVTMPAGKQRLKLVNDEKGLSKSVDVTIQAGKTTVVRFDL